MLLYKAIIPEKINENLELYYRSKGDVIIQEGKIKLQAGALVQFDTYFNGIFYSKYADYTEVKDIKVEITSYGDIIAELVCVTQDNKEIILDSIKLYNGKAWFPSVLIKNLPKGGMLFCKFKAVTRSEIVEVRYESSTSIVERVCVAVIICTYKREEYVKRNIEEINKKIWNCNSIIKDELDLIVVDNGNTLKLFNGEHITIIPNRNLGGSGGFTRGMIEVLNCGCKYTHVLLMDDDITFETEVIVRTIQILKCISDRQNIVCIGGQMLIETRPTIQYECGGRFEKGYLRANGQGRNVAYRSALLDNEKKQKIDYNAWWYCCIPVRAIRLYGLPIPLFIKDDDVEYGLRIKAEYLLMNGIGVWHKAFEQKQSPYLEYYIKRNELIVSALYNKGGGVIPSVIKLYRSLCGAILRRETTKIVYIKKAYIDFLKGPSFIRDTDAEILNTNLLKLKKDDYLDTLFAILYSAITAINISIKYLLKYKTTQQEYKRRKKELYDIMLWKVRLNIID